MMNNEINLWDLVKRIIYRWKYILIMMLVGAVVLNITAILKSRNNSLNNKTTQEEKLTEINAEEQFTDKLSVNQIEETQLGVQAYMTFLECYADTIEYNNESILVNLDANAVPTINIQYYIDTNYVVEYPEISKLNPCEAIIGAYENAILSMGPSIYEQIAKEIGVSKPEYIEELILVNNEENSLKLCQKSEGNMSIFICADSEEHAQIIANYVEDYIDKLETEIQDTYGEYEIKLVNRNFYVDVNTELLEIQQKQLTYINSLKNIANSITSNYSDDQKAYYNYLIDIELGDFDNTLVVDDTDVSDEQEMHNVTKINYINLKYIFIGALLGMLIGCCWIALKYIISNVLKVSDELESMYNIPLLGTISTKKTEILNKKENKFTEEERIAMICASIDILAKKSNMNRIYITGSCNDTETERLKILISDMLKNKNYVTEIGNTIIYDSESFEKACSLDGVIFIERVDYSLYSDIKKEIDLCKKFEIKVIGSIGIQ